MGFVEGQAQSTSGGFGPRADISKFAKILQGSHAFVILLLEGADRPADFGVKVCFAV
jgi:hypothetical protein